MDVGCFVLSLQVVEDTQHQGDSLDGGVEILLPQKIEEGHDENGSQILNVEDMLPSDLLPQIFETEPAIRKSDEFKIFIIVRQNNFTFPIFIGKFLLKDGYPGLGLKLLLDPLDSFLIISSDNDLPLFVFDVEV